LEGSEAKGMFPAVPPMVAVGVPPEAKLQSVGCVMPEKVRRSVKPADNRADHALLAWRVFKVVQLGVPENIPTEIPPVVSEAPVLETQYPVLELFTAPILTAPFTIPGDIRMIPSRNPEVRLDFLFMFFVNFLNGLC
jgi:hypothetical protein